MGAIKKEMIVGIVGGNTYEAVPVDVLYCGGDGAAKGVWDAIKVLHSPEVVFNFHKEGF